MENHFDQNRRSELRCSWNYWMLLIIKNVCATACSRTRKAEKGLIKLSCCCCCPHLIFNHHQIQANNTRAWYCKTVSILTQLTILTQKLHQGRLNLFIKVHKFPYYKLKYIFVIRVIKKSFPSAELYHDS